MHWVAHNYRDSDAQKLINSYNLGFVDAIATADGTVDRASLDAHRRVTDFGETHLPVIPLILPSLVLILCTIN